jgi:metal-responsive CopG/Arc/MetJ family transcriptional regulator
MTHTTKNKSVLGVAIDHEIFNAIQNYCESNKYINRSAFCNNLLREILVEKGMLEESA